MKLSNRVSAGVLVATCVFGIFELAMAATYVNLGNADSFAILAYSGITFSGTATVTGDIGSSPTNSITGLGGVVLNGTNHGNDATSILAQTSLATAIINAGQSPTTVPTELGSTTKFPGVYNSADGTFGMTGTLTLDAQGDPNAVFIFRTATTLVTAGASHVSLINGAQACNVFWQVGSSATLGSASVFKGNILASASIGVGTTANVEGRLLANTGAVTLDGTNVVTKATCVTPPSISIPGALPALPPVSTPPLINVTKIPTPLALPNGPGSVTYDYTVLNVGTVPMSNVTVTDNKCAHITFVSGDANGDAKLDTTEAWKYHCTTTLSQTTTNTVIATGQNSGITATDTANATVVVGVPLIPPLIHLVKVPNVFVLPAGGGLVVYQYFITNPGTAPLTDVSITDNKCTGLPGRVVGHPGDINKNNLLDPGETWQFTCNTNITQTTTNIGTAEGSANGLTAIDFSPATVIVADVVPKLPNTGLPPQSRTPWDIFISAGILMLVSTSLVLALRKR